MKRLWVLFVLMAMTLLVVGSVACGGDDDDSGDDGGSDPTATVDEGDDGGEEEDTGEAEEDEDSGDDGGGGDDYFAEVEAILDQADQDSAAVGEQYGGPYDDTADEIDQTHSAFVETGTIVEGVAVSMGDLDPPAEAQDAHDEYVGAVVSAAALFSEMAGELEDITTAEELTTFQEERGPDADAASAAIEEGCIVLQDLADGSGSSADLGCSRQD